MVRLATPIFPIMDSLYVDTFWFSIPYRLVWDNWEKFNGAQANPGDSTDYSIPRLANGSLFAEGSLADYFGLPILYGIGTMPISNLPFRAYNLVWNEWFRDQNFEPAAYATTGDGPEYLGEFFFAVSWPAA